MFKIAVCDDEKCFQNQIKEILADYMTAKGVVYEIDTFSSGKAFLGMGVGILQYKIIFLDINMADVDGVMTAQEIRKVSKELFIAFVTAYMDYTIVGYTVDAVRYIIKDHDLVKSIRECMDAVNEKMNYRTPCKVFHFKEGYRKVSLERLLYIESKLHKLEFHIMEEGLTKYTLRKTLDGIESELIGDGFARIHQSFLVNLRHVQDISRYKIILSNGKQISVPKEKYNEVKKALIVYKGET